MFIEIYSSLFKKNICYLLSHKSVSLFEEIPLESIGLGCGVNKGIYMFDRSMIMGRVPFWRICLNTEKVFNLILIMLVKNFFKLFLLDVAFNCLHFFLLNRKNNYA